MVEKTRILFVDDEPAYCRIFSKRIGKDPRFLVETASGGEEALSLLEQFPADMVFTDLQMPFMDGIELLTEIKKRYPYMFVLVLTGLDSTAQAVKAMKAGAYDYLLKPFDFEVVEKAINTVCAHRDACNFSNTTDYAQKRGFCFENIIGQDRKMFEIYERINQVSQTLSTVLITGESGTGKDLIAAAIHAKSARSNGPFLQVNCAALSNDLISSELFGHEKGAFTGAVSRKKGLFEQAEGGTLFLDEIGEISMSTQMALLRVLETGKYLQVGGVETLTSDVRLICATNTDLDAAVADKRFRDDLYYRINVVSINAPPLRKRPSDIPLLANYFLERFRNITGKIIEGFTAEAMELLCAYKWPGNCRELANMVEYAVVFSRNRMLAVDDFPGLLQKPSVEMGGLTLNCSSSTLAEVEKTLIIQVLGDKEWNLKQAAEALDIARGTLYSKMDKYNIRKPE
ncbi:MAG: sigma-54 dependent transcriptional regulator [Trichlorobacter sp.]|nr:sigma-54 dependent transcriptional regulator [Trichlorobacter sp.]